MGSNGKYLFSVGGVGLQTKLLSTTLPPKIGLIILSFQPLLDVLVLQSWTVKFMWWEEGLQISTKRTIQVQVFAADITPPMDLYYREANGEWNDHAG